MTYTDSNDLLTACGDGVLRVFSTEPQSWVSKEEIEAYNHLCLVEESNQNDQQQPEVNVNMLPKIDYIYKNKGKEGELRAFNNNGKGEAWMFQGGKWEKIGDVIGGEGDKPKDKFYEGDSQFEAGEYDFIFDVELDSHTSRLPFNFGGNRLIAAEKFCRREGLHKMYIDDIVKFLKTNASEKPIKQSKSKASKSTTNALDILTSVKLPIVSPIIKIDYFILIL